MRALSKTLEIIEESPLTGFDAKVKKMKQEGADIIALNVGQPDFEVPKSMRLAIKAVAEGAGNNFYTPVPGFPETRNALVKFHEQMYGAVYQAGDFVFTSGAKEAVALSIGTIIGSGDEAILIAPYWSTYKELIKFFGGKQVVVDTKKNSHMDIEKLKKAITNHTKAIIVNSPNNPSGAVYSKEELEMLVMIANENDLYIISDEIYNTIVFGVDYTSMADIKGSEERSIIINGFSKNASVTGYRLGYAVSKNQNIIKGIIKIKSNFSGNTNSFFQKIICEIADNRMDAIKYEIEEMRKEFELRKNYISSSLAALDFEHTAPEGSFYLWCKIPRNLKMNSKDFCSFMLKKGVALTPGIFFGKSYDGYIRISFASSMSNLHEAVKRIEKAVNSKET